MRSRKHNHTWWHPHVLAWGATAITSLGCASDRTWDAPQAELCSSCEWVAQGVPIEGRDAAVVDDDLYVLTEGTATIWKYSLSTGKRTIFEEGLYSLREIDESDGTLWVSTSFDPGQPLVRLDTSKQERIDLRPMDLSGSAITGGAIGPDGSLVVALRTGDVRTIAVLDEEGVIDRVVDVGQEGDVLQLIDAGTEGILWTRYTENAPLEVWFQDADETITQVILPHTFDGSLEVAVVVSPGALFPARVETHVWDARTGEMTTFDEMREVTHVAGTPCGFAVLHRDLTTFSLYDDFGTRQSSGDLPMTVALGPIVTADVSLFVGLRDIVAVPHNCKGAR